VTADLLTIRRVTWCDDVYLGDSPGRVTWLDAGGWGHNYGSSRGNGRGGGVWPNPSEDIKWRYEHHIRMKTTRA
jgi:hypothetical protein